MKKLNIKSILAGLVTLIVLDSVGAILLTLAFAGSLSGDAMREFNSDNVFLMVRSFVGIIAIIVGGMIVAKIAKAHAYFNAIWVGIVSLLVTGLSYDGSFPAWFNIVGLLFPFPAALLGAYFVAVPSERKP